MPKTLDDHRNLVIVALICAAYFSPESLQICTPTQFLEFFGLADALDGKSTLYLVVLGYVVFYATFWSWSFYFYLVDMRYISHNLRKLQPAVPPVTNKLYWKKSKQVLKVIG